MVDPSKNLLLMALLILFIGFSSATQDAMVDTYRIESCIQIDEIYQKWFWCEALSVIGASWGGQRPLLDVLEPECKNMTFDLYN